MSILKKIFGSKKSSSSTLNESKLSKEPKKNEEQTSEEIIVKTCNFDESCTNLNKDKDDTQVCKVCHMEYDVFKKQHCKCYNNVANPFSEPSSTSSAISNGRTNRRKPLTSYELTKLKFSMEKNKPKFDQLKHKMDNIKIFYPEVYNIQENIIEVWAQDKNILDMEQDILMNFDKEKKGFIWI
ncbi:unnamed protein product [Brassicogethes aeneus]|uniref:Uncharacterized protein n=1 Tax=Brassicogethes aeneus TaxID=1431903 RepID=A0A9P0AS75_BRAAE|nr:unnamed protein product [Brassicogethes aeneus]